MDAQRARILIEVVAGLIPNQPIPEFTRRFPISETTWAEGDEVMKTYGYAQEYSRSLWNPSRVNWVSLTWIYL